MLPSPSPSAPSKSELFATNESLSWLKLENDMPVWSRLIKCNTAGIYRDFARSKVKNYDVEIEDRLWSLWGSLSPEDTMFDASIRGRQYLAIYVMACCAASMRKLVTWSPRLMNLIVLSGSNYYKQSISLLDKKIEEFTLDQLAIGYSMGKNNFVVHCQLACSGKLYRMPSVDRMNLCTALMHFFKYYRYGIIIIHNRALAIGFCPGSGGGFFMFDCQAKNEPLFEQKQSAPYLLRTRHLQVLLYTIVVTLNMPCNMDFNIYNIEMLH